MIDTELQSSKGRPMQLTVNKNKHFKIEVTTSQSTGQAALWHYTSETGKEKIPGDSNTQSVEHIHTSLPKTA